jgi:hypothetical protein
VIGLAGSLAGGGVWNPVLAGWTYAGDLLVFGALAVSFPVAILTRSPGCELRALPWVAGGRQEQQRSRRQLAVGLADGLAGAVAQQGAVGEPGERVVQGLVLVFGGLAFGVPLVADHDHPEHSQQPKAGSKRDRGATSTVGLTSGDGPCDILISRWWDGEQADPSRPRTWCCG